MKSKQMIVFSIGPVQSFIVEARKTEDLWSGSFILSFLIEQALKSIEHTSAEVEFIYPKISKDDLNPTEKTGLFTNVASWPNRLTAFVHASLDETTKILQQAESVVRHEFKKISYYAIKQVFPEQVRTDYLKEKALKQIEQILEVYWIAQPYEGNYKQEREKLESRLNAIKNDKQYGQLEENGLSCTICAQRAALCMETIYKTEAISLIKQKVKATWKMRHKRFIGEDNAGRIRDEEYLCAICLGKRISREYFDKEVYVNAPSFKSFPSIIEIAGKYTYFAILSMDGDNMGTWFNNDSPEESSFVSQALANFSREVVPKVVHEANGYLVYTGGDDVLAFLPVDQALQVADTLRHKFGTKEYGLEGATASIGLIIGHRKAPLQLLLTEVQRLENLAKSFINKEEGKEKNALAFCVRTSSEKQESVVPWHLGEDHTTDLLNEVIELLTNNLSDTFIYRFSEVFSPLIQYACPDKDAMIQTELKRLIKRSAKESIGKQKIKKVSQQLVKLHKCMHSTHHFMMLLKMLTFFKRIENH